MTAAKLTEADLRRHAANGLSAQEIADKHGMTRQQVYHRAGGIGVTLRCTRGHNRRVFTDEQLLALMDGGHNAASAARALGVADSSVHNRLAKLGWMKAVPAGVNVYDYQIDPCLLDERIADLMADGRYRTEEDIENRLKLKRGGADLALRRMCGAGALVAEHSPRKDFPPIYRTPASLRLAAQ